LSGRWLGDRGRTLDELMANMGEVIELCLGELGEEALLEVIGIQA
jgi:predicted RNase H-like HicB family nuclease